MIVENCSHVLPCREEWHVVERMCDEFGKFESLHYEPVIAWLIYLEETTNQQRQIASTIPITIEGSAIGKYAIQRPNGTLFTSEGVETTKEEYLEYGT